MLSLSLFDLSGKKALVTGGAAGIGRGCALALAMAGADVAIIDRDEQAGNETTALIRKMGRASLCVRCDVREAASVTAMIESVVQGFGRLDIAVNNAGIYREGTDEAQSKDDWDQVMAVNLTGTWLCARAEMQQMVRQTPAEGKIINIASIAATTVLGNSNGAYDASKAGVAHLTRTLAAQWGRHNINVNSVSPGYVLGGMGAQRSLEERQRIRESTPLGHVQRVQDLYGPILFFASRASDYVTGQNLIVDGGYTLSASLAPLERSVAPRIDPAGELS